MRLEWDGAKEVKNIANHGLDFSFAEQVLTGQSGEGRKRFFFEKKNQKTFACLG